LDEKTDEGACQDLGPRTQGPSTQQLTQQGPWLRGHRGGRGRPEGWDKGAADLMGYSL
jgi:hypothetical protein